MSAIPRFLWFCRILPSSQAEALQRGLPPLPGEYSVIYSTIRLPLRRLRLGGGLVLLDTLTGVTAAWQAGESITSKAFSRTIVKLIGYGAALAVVAVVTRHIAGLADYQPVAVSSVLSLVIVTEAGSILENVRKLGVRLPFGIEELLRRRLRQISPDSDGE